MKKIAAYLKFLVLALGLQAAGSWPLYAGAPMKINFQGRLEESGQPAEGAKNFVFKIYDAASGGSLVWTSQTQSLTLSKGVFSAVLSAGSPADISTTTFSAARYVEITIDGVPLSPRQEMVSAPYALVAQALAADAQLPSSSLSDGSVTDAKVVLTTAAISSGRFGDDRVIITTGAFSGGFNAAYRLVQLDVNGKLPVLDGSALQNIITSTAAIVAALGTKYDSVNFAAGTDYLAPAGDGSALQNVITSTAAIVAALGTKYDSVNFAAGSNYLTPAGDGSALQNIITSTAAIQADINGRVMDAGDTMTGDLTMSGDAKIIAGSSIATTGAFFGNGSQLTNLDPANLSAAVTSGKGGTGQDSSLWTGFAKVSAGAWSAAALAAADIPVLDTAKISTGKFNDNMLAISTGAFAGGFNTAGKLLALDGNGKLPAADGSLLTSLSPANLSAAIANNKGGTGQDSSLWTGFAKVTAGAWSAGALAAGDIPSLDAAKITTGKFNDNRMAISTGAFPGGFNGADQLARLDASGRLGISTGTVNSPLTVGGSVSLPIRRITNADTPYPVSENDHTILADAAGGDITVTLPNAAAGAGRVYTIKRISSSGTITIGSAGGQIDGAASQIMNTLMGESMLLQSDGTDWFILFWYWQ